MSILILLALTACKADVETGEGVQVKMDFARKDFYDAPFPSDDLLDGTVDLSGFPNPDGIEFVEVLFDLLDGRAEGYGVSAGVHFPMTGAVDPASLPSLHRSIEAGASVQLIHLDSGEPHPIEVGFHPTGGPFSTDNVLSLLPLQGVPMRPEARYAAVVTRSVRDAEGNPLQPSSAMNNALLGAEVSPGTQDALAALADAGIDPGHIAGLSVFTTQDPEGGLFTFMDHARTLDTPELDGPLTLIETHPELCVYESSLKMPTYQRGEPPFLQGGGGWPDKPEVYGQEDARIFVTVPRTPADSPKGYPVAVMIRTGGGGDRPMIDRGVRDSDGVAPPGTGPGMQFARAGWIGVSVDGPHGGVRNVTGGDEQFLIFNIGNPVAMRDNLRQSALELALLPDVLEAIDLDESGCAGASGGLDTSQLALMGHSMGGTIAPLVLAIEPRYQAAILSGAGGSWVHNIVWKKKPLDVRPIAQTMLKYEQYGAELHDFDPVLGLLQWAGEVADPPIYGHHLIDDATDPVDVLMVQGIVDRYILPPMANATSLSIGLDLGGKAHDVGHPELKPFWDAEEVLPLVGRDAVDLPVKNNRGDVTALVVQHLEDGVEDGHEVAFQVPGARHQYRCFLETLRTHGEATVPAPAAKDDAPCR